MSALHSLTRRAHAVLPRLPPVRTFAQFQARLAIRNLMVLQRERMTIVRVSRALRCVATGTRGGDPAAHDFLAGAGLITQHGPHRTLTQDGAAVWADMVGGAL